MGLLWDIIERYRASIDYQVSIRQIALRLNLDPATVRNWRDNLRSMPAKENLFALADLTGVSDEEIIEAALRDAGYRRKSRVGSLRSLERVKAELDLARIERA